MLCILSCVSGAAMATSPLPPIEEQVDLNGDFAIVRSGILDKQDTIPEQCLPRDLILCVGPYDPDLEFEFGATGVRLITNDSYVLVGHDPTDHREYGPIRIPLLLDDLWICSTGCIIPDPAYTDHHANATVIVYVFGREYAYSVEPGNER